MYSVLSCTMLLLKIVLQRTTNIAFLTSQAVLQTIITLAPIRRRKHAHYWTNVWINVSSLYGLRTHCIESVCTVVQFAGWSWPDKSALEISLELAIRIQFIRIQLVSLNYSDIIFFHLNTKTSQELRMLSRSLFFLCLPSSLIFF